MKVLGVIPARLGSTRLARKPLREIAGKLLIEHVYGNIKKAKSLDGLVVATDAKEIYDAVDDFGGEVVMTSPRCASGTERVAEVAQKYKKYDIFVNIQGDEPLITGGLVDKLVKAIQKEKTAPIASLYVSKTDPVDFENPNAVKVTLDKNGYALYFSRSPIPYNRSSNGAVYMKHLGIYAYRKKFLMAVGKLKASLLENQEKLEQLKWLDNGYRIHMASCRTDAIGVDTEEDLRQVEKILKKGKRG